METLYTDDTVSVIDTTTQAVTALINVGMQPQFIAITPDGSKVYVLNNIDGTVSVIDTTTNTVIATINVGSGPASSPSSLVITPDGQKVYVVTTTDNTVNVIDTATNTVSDTIGVGNAPVFIALAFSPSPPPPPLPPPPPSSVSMSGKQQQNEFGLQTEFFNRIIWTAPTFLPFQYLIYRDAALTDLAGAVSADQFTFEDHSRKKYKTYDDYLVAVMENGNHVLIGNTTVGP